MLTISGKRIIFSVNQNFIWNTSGYTAKRLSIELVLRKIDLIVFDCQNKRSAFKRQRTDTGTKGRKSSFESIAVIKLKEPVIHFYTGYFVSGAAGRTASAVSLPSLKAL